MKIFRSRFTKRYGNYYKIYFMSLWKLIILNAFLFVVLFFINISKFVQKIPYLIITPSGIHIDRRVQHHPFRAAERRFINILRYKFYIWLYGSDDMDGVQ